MVLYEECRDPDIVKQAIGLKPEGEEPRQLSVKVSERVYTLMRETAADKEVSMAELVERMVSQYCVPAFDGIPEDKLIELICGDSLNAERILRESQYFGTDSYENYVLSDSERELIANGIFSGIWDEIEAYDPVEDSENWAGELVEMLQINLLFRLNTLEKIWPGWIEEYDEACYEEEIEEDDYDLIVRKKLRNTFDIYQKDDKAWDTGYFNLVIKGLKRD